MTMSDRQLTLEFIRMRPELDQDLPLPEYMTEEAAGLDVSAGVKEDQTILPGRMLLVPTGFAMALPKGYEAQVRPRSGLAVKHGIGIVNSPGTIDADYRGEVQIALINFGSEPYTIRRGDRIAQLVINRIDRVFPVLVEKLKETSRGRGGFGHTGK